MFRKFTLAFSVVILAAGLGNAVVFMRLLLIEDASRWSAHAHDVAIAVNDMLIAVIDQETGLRGFLNTGDEAFLEPYHTGTAHYRTARDHAMGLVAESAEQSRIALLDEAVRSWREESAEPMIRLARDPATRDEALKLAAQGEGKRRMDRVRERATAIRAHQEERKTQWRNARAETSAEAEVASALSTMLSILVALGGALWLTRSIAAPTVLMARQMRQLADGDLAVTFPPMNRTDEIGVMASTLADFQAALRERQRLAEAEREHLAQLRAAEAELVEAQKLAALGQLVAGIAHEINTPIGSSLTVATTLDEKRRQFEESVNAGALRRSTLVEFLGSVAQAGQLLSLSLEQAAGLVSSFKQVAADRTSAQRRRFDLAQVTTQVLATLRPLHKRTEIAVAMAIPDGITFDSYPGPYGQIIGNLVTNALFHGFDGRESGQVEIRLAGRDDDTVLVEVADNGTGIPPGAIARVFEPFFTTRLGQGGSGLGLHIVHNLVTGVLGGRVTVTSALGQGSVFTLRIPTTAPHERGVA